MAHARSSKPAYSDAVTRHQAQVIRLGLGSAFPICNRCKKLKSTGVLVGGCTCEVQPK